MTKALTIIYRDAHLIAINKPSGLLVHRSAIDRHETQFAVQLLRDQIQQPVFPVHRLDKPTSGVLLFALSSECARRMGMLFSEHQLTKTYLALVRGIAPGEGHINHPLLEEIDSYDMGSQQKKLAQIAITNYQTLAEIELPVAVETYPTSRYSLVQCQPQTGRKHQIRRHMKHINHPIIGDAKHGRGRHNRFFIDQFNCRRLLLAATQLDFCHPYSGVRSTVVAPITGSFRAIIREFSWDQYIPPLWLAKWE